MPEQIFMKIDVYFIASETISTAYFINPPSQSVCFYVYPLSLLDNGSVKIPLSLLGNGSVSILPWQRISTQQ
jgi:hypothetical protein